MRIQIGKMFPPLPYDRLLVLLVVTIAVMGLLMIASASVVISEQQYGNAFHFFIRQFLCLILGAGVGFAVVQIPLAFWEMHSREFLLLACALLVMVLIPGLSRSVNGSARWVAIGPLGLQVSEIAKASLLIYMAGYLVRHGAEVREQFIGFARPMAILALVALLLLKEPDFGTAAVISVTLLGIMFLAGMRLQYFFLLFGLMGSSLAVLAISAPYRWARLTTFLNPWANAFDKGYQLTQSLIAFGRGGLWGVGFGKSIEKLFYLPEAHTDFLFAVLAEELGLLGALSVITLFTLLTLRILWVGRRALALGRPFAGYLAFGCGLMFAIQFIVSIGVNSGVLPTKGLTLPLMSYGGSSLLVTCAILALIFRIDYENRLCAMGVDIK